MSLLNQLRDLVLQGWSFALKDGALAYRALKNEHTAQVLAQLKQNKEALLELLRKDSDCLNVLPLSQIQQALWFEWQKAPESGAYNVAFALEIRSRLRPELLEQAFSALLRRHQALHCRYLLHEGRPIAQALSQATGEFIHSDVAGLDAEQLRAEVYRHNHLPFALDVAPPVRLSLLSRSAESHVLLLTFHHIAADGFSQIKMMVELFEHYLKLLAGQPLNLSPAEPGYGEFARWQRQLLEGPEKERLLAYWQAQLADAPMLLDMPLDHPRGEVESFNGALLEFPLSTAQKQTLDQLARDTGSTRYAVLLALWQTLLYRYSGQADFLVGAPFFGRSEERFAEVIGNFVDPVVLRARFSPELSFKQLLAQVQDSVTDAIQHQELPFSTLVQALKPQRYPGAGLMFQTSFVLNKFWQFNQLSPEQQAQYGLEMSIYPVYGQQGMTDLDLVFEEKEATLIGVIKYNQDLYQRATIAAMAGHFQQLLASVAADSAQPVSRLAMLSAAEWQQLRQQLEYRADAAPSLSLSPSTTPSSSFNAGDDSYVSLVAQFEAQAARRPEAIALQDSREQLSYAEANRRANQLAHYLREQACTPGSLVGVAMDRHVDLVVALLAIQKLGAAWVPLDPSQPLQRLSYMVEDAGLAWVICDSAANRSRLPPVAHLLCYDAALKAQLAGTDDSNLGAPPGADQPAYVIYTSGSTGLPKGVMVEQGNLANFLAGMVEQFGGAFVDGQCKTPAEAQSATQSKALNSADESGIWLAATGLSFDISILELLCPLARGFKVIIASEQRLQLQAQGQGLAHQHLPMQFSLYFFASDIGDVATGKYDLLLNAARFADSHGFTAIWTPERHFDAFGGLYPNPAITSAAIAVCTQQLGIRSGSCVLPLHNPLRVVEDWAVVDNLSQGRVGMAFASGWQENDFIIRPEAYADRFQILQRDLAEVRALWRGDAVEKLNPKGQPVQVLTKPRPLQAELPVWLTIAGNPEAFRAAGRDGINILTHLLGQSLPELAAKIALYREAWREAGHPGEGHVTLMLHTFVSDDQDHALATVERPFKNYLAQSLALMKSLALEQGLDLDALDEDQFAQVLNVAFNRYRKSSALFGTPEHCLALVDEVKGIGVDEIACLIDFGIDANAVLEQLPHLHQLQLLSQARNLPPARSIAEWLAAEEVSHFQCTPSLLGALLTDEAALDGLAKLRHLLVGGEALSLQLIKDLYRGIDARAAQHATAPPLSPQLTNMYGPTETTIWSSCWRYSPGSERVSLGRPIRNTRLYIVDAQLNALPPGRIGELLIAGDGVARGYLNRPELNQEKFIPNPFHSGERAYLTGDLVRLNHDGTLVYVGRNDSQVKLRGMRIELGEIERHLEQEDGVKVAVVLVSTASASATNSEGAGVSKRLLGFILPEDHIQPSSAWLRELQRALASRLPEYMVPAQLVVVNSFALNSNGKIDRKVLAQNAGALLLSQISSQQELAESSEREAAQPQNPVEQRLHSIWAELLGLAPAQLSIDDNFFDLGGDSIIAIHLVSRAVKAGLNLKVNQLLKYPSIRQLAGQLQLAPQTHIDQARVDQGPVSGAMPLLPIQRAFFEQREQMAHHNQTLLLKAPKALSLAQLEQIFAAILQRHDALRLRFTADAQDAYGAEFMPFQPQQISALVSAQSCRADFSDLTERANQVQRNMALEQGRLLQVVLFDNGADHATSESSNSGAEKRLLIAIHHLVVDGVSWRVLLDDLSSAWQQLQQQQAIQLAAKGSSYQAWGQALADYAHSPQLLNEVAYWQQVQSAAVDDLPNQSQAVADESERLGRLDIVLDAGPSQALLQEANQAYQTRTHELLLSALSFALHQLGDQQQGRLRIDLEGHGREPLFDALDISQTVGWFTSVYPLLVQTQHSAWPTLIREVKERCRQLPHNGIGYGIAKYLASDERAMGLRHSPRAQVLFNYLGQFDFGKSADFDFAQESPGEAISIPQQLLWGMNFNGLVRDGQLQFILTYDRQRHGDAQMAQLAQQFEQALRALSQHCLQQQNVLHSPADFGLKGVSIAQLDEWQRRFDFVDAYPMTKFQQGVLLLRSNTYISQLVLEMQDLDRRRFAQAWQRLVDQHDIFRSVFVGLDSLNPHQLVLRQAQLRWQDEDLCDLSPQQQDQHILAQRQQDRAAGANPQQAPLMRFTTWDLGGGRCKVLWTYHHCLIDGWSVPLLFEQLSKLYQGLGQGENISVQRGEPYGRYVRWLQQNDHQAAFDYWRRSLNGVAAIAQDSDANEADLEAVIKELEVRFDQQRSAALVEAARQHQVTLSLLVQAAWALMLGLHRSSEQVVFGTVLSGRSIDLAAVDRIVGPFINTIPVKMDLPGEMDLGDWLRQLLNQAADRDEYGYLPLSDIKHALALPANREFFDTVIVDNSVQTNNFVENIDWHQAGLKLLGLENVQEINVALSMNFVLPNDSRELVLTWRYDQTRYSATEIRGRADALVYVLEQFCAGHAQTLAQLRDGLAEYQREQAESAKAAFKSKRRTRRERGRTAVEVD